MKLIKPLLVFLLIVWLGISVTRLVYNYTKVYTQEKSWIFKSTDEKKELLFGDIYPAMQFITNHTTKNDSITFITPHPDIEPRLYYLSFYYLYPRELSFVKTFVKAHTQYQVLYVRKNDFKSLRMVSKKNQSTTFIGKDIIVVLIKKL